MKLVTNIIPIEATKFCLLQFFLVVNSEAKTCSIKEFRTFTEGSQVFPAEERHN